MLVKNALPCRNPVHPDWALGKRTFEFRYNYMILGKQSKLRKKGIFCKIWITKKKVYLYSTVLTIILAKSELYDFTQGKNYYGRTFHGTLTDKKNWKNGTKRYNKVLVLHNIFYFHSQSIRVHEQHHFNEFQDSFCAWKWLLFIIPRPGHLHRGNICQCYPCRSSFIWQRTGCSTISVSHTPN